MGPSNLAGKGVEFGCKHLLPHKALLLDLCLQRRVLFRQFLLLGLKEHELFSEIIVRISTELFQPDIDQTHKLRLAFGQLLQKIRL